MGLKTVHIHTLQRRISHQTKAIEKLEKEKLKVHTIPSDRSCYAEAHPQMDEETLHTEQY